MSTSFWLRVGAIWGFLAVAIGAFGAHGLKDRFKSLGDQFGPLTTERPEGIFQTATHYHAYCALAILAVGLLAANGRERDRASSRRLVVSAGFADLLRQPVRAGRDGHQTARHDHADRRSAHARSAGWRWRWRRDRSRTRNLIVGTVYRMATSCEPKAAVGSVEASTSQMAVRMPLAIDR